MSTIYLIFGIICLLLFLYLIVVLLKPELIP